MKFAFKECTRVLHGPHLSVFGTSVNTEAGGVSSYGMIECMESMCCQAGYPIAN